MKKPRRRDCQCRSMFRCKCSGWNESWDAWEKYIAFHIKNRTPSFYIENDIDLS